MVLSPAIGSLTYSGSLPITGSLKYFGALKSLGSLKYSGALRRLGSLTYLGALLWNGSLSFPGSLLDMARSAVAIVSVKVIQFLSRAAFYRFLDHQAIRKLEGAERYRQVWAAGT
jgi:hypothetical protein